MTTRSSLPRTRRSPNAGFGGASGVVHGDRARGVRGVRAVTTPDAIHAADERLAAAVVTRSVPPNSLGNPAEIEVNSRKARKLNSVAEPADGTDGS